MRARQSVVYLDTQARAGLVHVRGFSARCCPQSQQRFRDSTGEVTAAERCKVSLVAKTVECAGGQIQIVDVDLGTHGEGSMYGQ